MCVGACLVFVLLQPDMGDRNDALDSLDKIEILSRYMFELLELVGGMLEPVINRSRSLKSLYKLLVYMCYVATSKIQVQT